MISLLDTQKLIERWSWEYRVALEMLDPDRAPMTMGGDYHVGTSSVLANLIKYRGYVPCGGGDRKPPDSGAALVEDIVYYMHKVHPRAALCLRVKHCAYGSIEDKTRLVSKVMGHRVGNGRFYGFVDAGESFVLSALNSRFIKTTEPWPT